MSLQVWEFTREPTVASFFFCIHLTLSVVSILNSSTGPGSTSWSRNSDRRIYTLCNNNLMKRDRERKLLHSIMEHLLKQKDVRKRIRLLISCTASWLMGLFSQREATEIIKQIYSDDSHSARIIWIECYYCPFHLQ